MFCLHFRRKIAMSAIDVTVGMAAGDVVLASHLAIVASRVVRSAVRKTLQVQHKVPSTPKPWKASAVRLGAILRQCHASAQSQQGCDAVNSERFLMFADLALLELRALNDGTASKMSDGMAWIPVQSHLRKDSFDLITSLERHVQDQQNAGRTIPSPMAAARQTGHDAHVVIQRKGNRARHAHGKHVYGANESETAGVQASVFAPTVDCWGDNDSHLDGEWTPLSEIVDPVPSNAEVWPDTSNEYEEYEGTCAQYNPWYPEEFSQWPQQGDQQQGWWPLQHGQQQQQENNKHLWR